MNRDPEHVREWWRTKQNPGSIFTAIEKDTEGFLHAMRKDGLLEYGPGPTEVLYKVAKKHEHQWKLWDTNGDDVHDVEVTWVCLNHPCPSLDAGGGLGKTTTYIKRPPAQ